MSIVPSSVTSATVKVRLPEQAQVEHRVGERPLPPHEQHAERQPTTMADERQRPDAVGGELLEAVDDGQDRGQRQRDADQVEPARLGVAVLRQQDAARATSSSTITGTASRNTEPHQKCSSSTPPTTGPSAMPTEKR